MAKGDKKADKPAAAAAAAKAPAKSAAAVKGKTVEKEKKGDNPLFPKRPKNFRVGGDIRVRIVSLRYDRASCTYFFPKKCAPVQ
jgi:hypothetical protein